MMPITSYDEAIRLAQENPSYSRVRNAADQAERGVEYADSIFSAELLLSMDNNREFGKRSSSKLLRIHEKLPDINCSPQKFAPFLIKPIEHTTIVEDPEIMPAVPQSTDDMIFNSSIVPVQHNTKLLEHQLIQEQFPEFYAALHPKKTKLTLNIVNSLLARISDRMTESVTDIRNNEKIEKLNKIKIALENEKIQRRNKNMKLRTLTRKQGLQNKKMQKKYSIVNVDTSKKIQKAKLKSVKSSSHVEHLMSNKFVSSFKISNTLKRIHSEHNKQMSYTMDKESSKPKLVIE